MPTDYQTSAAILVARQRETVRGVKATDGAGSAKVLRIFDSPGFDVDRTNIANEENRADQVMPRPRLGSRRVPASYNGPLTIGGAQDEIWEEIMRSTWTAATPITEAAMTSITTTNATIVAAAGSWITQGVRVGDVARLTGHATAANNDRNLRVVSVTASTLGVRGTGTDAETPLTANAVADTAFTLTILKRVKTAAAPVRRTATYEQYSRIIDQSEVGTGLRTVGFNISARPDSNVTYALTLQGMDREILSTAASPYFTSPTSTTGLPLVVNDAVLRYNGADTAHFTGFDLNFQIAADTVAVGGSLVTPDVFDNKLTVSGSITLLRSSLANLTLFENETAFEIFLLLEEPTALPRHCVGIFLPNVSVGKPSAPAGGGTGPLVETVTLNIGPIEAATGYDAGVATISSSAA